MTSIQPVVMLPDNNARAYAESIAPAHTEDGSPGLHATDEMRRLATPWTVAITKANLLDSSGLSQGVILDPACGSATQLAALCTVLNRPGLGVELSGAVAPLAAVNLEKCAQSSNEDWSESSRILWGDGTDAKTILNTYHMHIEQNPTIALLHVDPARPNDAQKHTLDEMRPSLGELLTAWAPYLGNKPSIILDLSPRLLDEQRLEVQSIVSSIFGEVTTTWQWLTQGRGRIDRLSLWIGGAAGPHQNRLVRLTKSGLVHLIEGPPMKSVSNPSDVEIGEHLVIVDPSLIASGLGESWRDTCGDGDTRWHTINGRRPILISSQRVFSEESRSESSKEELERIHSMIQTYGEIIAKVPELTQDSISEIVDMVDGSDITSLKLRCTLEPETQPKLQSQIDRELRRKTLPDSPRSGFITEVNNSYVICKEYD